MYFLKYLKDGLKFDGCLLSINDNTNAGAWYELAQLPFCKIEVVMYAMLWW